MVQRIDPTCGPLGRLRRKACCSYDACGVILFSVWIIASSVFLFKARQFYWHSWKSLKMQELYEGGLAATELYDIGVFYNERRWEYLTPYKYMFAYFTSAVDCSFSSNTVDRFPWSGFAIRTFATGCNTTLNTSLFEDDFTLDDKNFFALHNLVGEVGSTKNFCNAQYIGLFTAGKTDEKACGVNSRNEQGCYAGFYTPLKTPFTATSDNLVPVVDYAGPGEPCAPGYFCPQDLDCMIPCLPGSVCVQSVHTGGGGDDLLSSFDDDFGLSSSTAVGLDDYYSLPDDYYNRLLDDDLLNTTANTDDLASVDDSVDLLFNPYSSEPCKYLLDGGSYHLASADSSSIFNSSLALTIGEANYNYRERCPGASSVYLCPGGYYCQTPLSAEKCTKGHYCPKGSYIQKRCKVSFWCQAEGLSYPNADSYVIIFLGCGFILFVVTYFASSKVMEMRVKIRREKQELVLQERRQYRERYYGPNSKGVRPSQKSKRSSRQSRSQRETATRNSLEMSEGDKAGGRAEDGGSRVWTIKSLVEVKFDTHTEVKTVLGATWSTHLVLILVAVIFVIIAIACFSAGGDSWIAGLVFLLIALPCLAGSSFAVDRLRQSNGDGSWKKKKGRGGASVLELGSIEVKTDSRINIEVQNLGLVLNVNGREVLKGVNGTLQSGSVTALMGPSGAGKTTFLNTLSGRATYGTVTGKMLINGEERELNSISNLVGFVPQDDVMHRELTVRETLKYYARLRNRKTALRPWGHREIERRVQDVIEVLGIGHIVDSPIGDEAKRGISGGQRKRVNVGMEMVADPSLLFLDEPTSGLDSTTSYELVTALSNLALKGVNVIAVLHQPSFQLYEQFQNVLLLGAGGRTVYLGPANGALGYFTSSGFDLPRHMNPADFFMDVIAGKVKRNGHPDFEKTDLFPLWDEKRGPIEDACKHSLVPAEPLKAEVIERNGSAPFASQVYVFAKRAGQQHVRAVDSAVGDVFLIFGIGLILGFTYNTGEMSNFANTALMFSFGLSLGIGLATLRVFGNELLVYWREAAPGAGMGLSRLGYFIGKNIVEIPRIFLLVLVASAVFYPLAQLLSSYHEFLWQSFFLAWHVSGIAQFLSVALDGKTAQLALVILLLVFLLEAGVQTPFYKMEGVEVWISWLSPSRWYVDDVTLSNAAQVSVGYRLPPTWYKSGGSSLFAILKKLWMPEAIINSPHISSYRGLRRMGAEWAERQGLWYHYIAGNKVNVTSVWTPADLPKVNLNLLMSLYWGIIWRAFAFIALCTCNADKMGKQSWTTKVIHSALEKRCLDSCDRNFGNADEDEEDEGGDDDDDEEEEHDDENKTGNPLHVEVIMDPEDDKRIRTPSMLGTDVV